MSKVTKEQVIEWLSSQPVIELAALVKDLEGKWTKIRTCLDPRAVNTLINYTPLPIPVIMDLLVRVRGFWFGRLR